MTTPDSQWLAPSADPGAPAHPAAARVSLWGGRFAGGPAPEMAALSASVQFDHRLAVHDLQASRAHARVLHRIGLLEDAELTTMTEVLDGIEVDVRAGAVEFGFADEDVHTALERVLIERAGTVGGKLRAGRSRNDQVATDLRLYLRVQARAVAGAVLDLADALIAQAETHAATPAPGFTHLQHAQPVTLGHVLAAHAHALHRISTGCATGTSGPRSARSVPVRWPDRPSHSTRRPLRPISASTVPSPTPSTPSPTGTSWRSSSSSVP